MQETQVQSLSWEDPLEKGKAITEQEKKRKSEYSLEVMAIPTLISPVCVQFLIGLKSCEAPGPANKGAEVRDAATIFI